jgi:hypothetical protein
MLNSQRCKNYDSQIVDDRQQNCYPYYINNKNGGQYEAYKLNVDQFKQKLVWANVAEMHKALYRTVVEEKLAGFVINH